MASSRSAKRKRRRERMIRAEHNDKVLQLGGQVAITAAADESGAPTIAIVAYGGGVMQPPGWPKVVLALDGIEAKNRVPIIGDHENKLAATLGSGIASVANGQLHINGTLSKSSSLATQLIAMSSDGAVFEASIGAVPLESRTIAAGRSVAINGRTFKAGPGGLLVVDRARLRHVGILPNGADDSTSVSIAASEGEVMEPKFQEWLQAKGFDPATLADEAKAFLQAQFNAAQAEPEDDDDEPEQITAEAAALEARAAVAAELKRVKTIEAKCKEFAGVVIKGNDGAEEPLAIHAIEAGWTPEATELYGLRHSTPKAPAAHIRTVDRDSQLQALQGGMIMRAGLALDAKVWGKPEAMAIGVPAWLRAGLNTDQRQKAMEAAWRFRDMSLLDVCREAVRIDGKDISFNRAELIQAAFSGSALTNIFTTNVNAAIIAGYMESGDTTGGWTSTVDVADFKTNERIRLEAGPNLERLPRGKTATHMNYSDKLESYKIARYSKQFVIDEQDIVDDSFNAFATVPGSMGKAAARLRPDLVYGIMMANPTLNATSRALFHATEGNLNTSAAFAAATLKAAISDMRLFQDNGINIEVNPTHLIVPPTLEWTAKELLNSTQILIQGGGDDEAFKDRGNANVLQSANLTPVFEKRLENGVTRPDDGTSQSGSASTWYLAAAGAHTIEVAHLRGSGRAPQVRSFALSEGKYGMGWDVKLDIGACPLDWRGLHKNTA